MSLAVMSRHPVVINHYHRPLHHHPLHSLHHRSFKYDKVYVYKELYFKNPTPTYDYCIMYVNSIMSNNDTYSGTYVHRHRFHG